MSTSKTLSLLALSALLSTAAYARSDADDASINAEVRQQIEQRPSLGAQNITVRTVDHVVYLEGLVDTRMDRSLAGAIARSVPGVTKVYNGLGLDGNG